MQLPVHPHMRGDHDRTRNVATVDVGSSSHAWGPQRRVYRDHPYDRFILTCVGTTIGRGVGVDGHAVHPHMRGDHQRRRVCQLPVLGSSSHAWGPLHPGAHQIDTIRFILTCVGTTTSMTAMLLLRSVHPHMRGDHSRWARLSVGSSGSSSHAWGPHRWC